MKVVSLQLPSGPSMERLPLPFSPTELLWRYPLPWAPPPPSPLGDTKAQLPAGLPPEPRLWTREDVAVFLKWCEREFDLPNFDMDLFQMNGMQIVLRNNKIYHKKLIILQKWRHSQIVNLFLYCYRKGSVPFNKDGFGRTLSWCWRCFTQRFANVSSRRGAFRQSSFFAGNAHCPCCSIPTFPSLSPSDTHMGSRRFSPLSQRGSCRRRPT